MSNERNNQEIVQKIKDLVKDIPYTLTVNCCKLPLSKIDREKFLRTELKKYYPEKVISKAIETNPHAAGIPVKIINKIADSCIEYERGLTTGIAAGLGLPGIASNAAFIGICAYIIPLPIMLFEVFVAFIQAFVFTLLSMSYIAISVQEEH